MSRRTALAVASLLAIAPLSAFAQESSTYPGYTVSGSSGGSDFLGLPDGSLSAGAKLGTLGIGGELGYRPFQMFGARIDSGACSFSDDFRAGHVNYHATAELQSYGALADLYPFGESFRVTGGLRLNENQVRGDSTSIQVSSGGQTFDVPTSEAGSLGAKVTFDKLSPYLGFGWGGELAPGLSITTDLGVMFNGNPKASVDGTLNSNAAALLGPSASQLTAAGVASARTSLQGYVDGYEYYPVIEIGLTYKF